MPLPELTVSTVDLHRADGGSYDFIVSATLQREFEMMCDGVALERTAAETSCGFPEQPPDVIRRSSAQCDWMGFVILTNSHAVVESYALCVCGNS
jgi:hypothetical protein